jgi:rhodanese-related sulfurtransferase
MTEVVVAAGGLDTSEVFLVDQRSAFEAIRMQASRTYSAVVVGHDVVLELDPAHRRLLIHNLVSHLPPGGWLLTPCARTAAAIAADAESTGLSRCEPDAEYHRWRRSDRRTIHDLVAEARARIRRWTPSELHAALLDRAGAPDLIVLDTRTLTDRERDGFIPGSIHVPRTVLEWRVDPASGYSIAEIHSFDQPLVVVCTGGYSSSLAAATLVDLGFVHAGDLVGGTDAWGLAGFDLVPSPPHLAEDVHGPDSTAASGG